MSAVATRTRVPRKMLTGPNCVTVPVGNDYARGRHSYKRGDLMLVDCGAIPRHDDFVIVFAETKPFGRICEIGPAPFGPREQMVMGVLDEDGDTICMIELGRGGRQFGVVVGIVPTPIHGGQGGKV